MRISHAMLAAALLTVGIDFPAASVTPQVCRGHDEGYEVFTDCYGMALTGLALRDAQIRDLVQDRRSPAEIAAMLGVRITTLPVDRQACPPGMVHIPDIGQADGQPRAVHCAY